MGLFQFIQDTLGNVTESVQTPIDEITQLATDNELVQGAQDTLGSVTEVVGSATESVTTGATDTIDQVKQNIGL